MIARWRSQFSSRSILKVVILLTLLLAKSFARLVIYDHQGHEIGSYNQVDFMGLDLPSYGSIYGGLAVAKFQGDKCSIDLLENVAILVIPFDKAMNSGCESYADVLLR